MLLEKLERDRDIKLVVQLTHFRERKVHVLEVGSNFHTMSALLSTEEK